MLATALILIVVAVGVSLKEAKNVWIKILWKKMGFLWVGLGFKE